MVSFVLTGVALPHGAGHRAALQAGASRGCKLCAPGAMQPAASVSWASMQALLISLLSEDQVSGRAPSLEASRGGPASRRAISLAAAVVKRHQTLALPW